MSLGQQQSTQVFEASTQKWRRRAFVAWALLGFCGLAWVLGVVLNVLATPMGILLWCLILVFALSPLVDFFVKKGTSRAVGTLLAFVVLFLVLIFIGIILFAPGIGASSQFVSLGESLPAYARGFWDGVTAATERYSTLLQDPTVQGWIAQVTDSLYSFLGEFASTAGTSIVGFGSFLANTAMILGFALVISFWILMELPGIEREIRRLVSPNIMEDYELFSTTMVSVIGGYLKATLLQCFIIGLGCGIAYAIMGLPGPAALGIITGLLNIIPVVGPWIGGAVAAMVGFTVSPVAALSAIVVAVIIQQVVYTFISPMLMSDSVDIHPALVIFGLTVGSAVGGAMAGLAGSVLGMLASIPLIAAAKALFVYYYERNTGRRIVAPDGVFFKGDVPEGSHDDLDPSRDAAAAAPAQKFEIPLEKLPLRDRRPTDEG